jgi:hypothetical protein
MNGRERKPEPADERVPLETRLIATKRRVGVSAPQRPGTQPADPVEAYMRTPELRDHEGMANGS